MISLYFHIPFCSKKCPYCHFYVIPNRALFHSLLFEGLEREWEENKKLLQGRTIASIYFGGGTPSLFAPEKIEAIVNWVRKDAQMAPDCEITLEANPEEATPELFSAFLQAGINRLSLGVQSLDDRSLQTLERTHTAKKAKEAIFSAHASGLKNITIDLMYDLPDQTEASWTFTLDQLSELPIQHLSLYNLTIEPHTSFSKRKLQLPHSHLSLQMLETALAKLESIGLKRYEISAFCKPGFASRHNLGYWTGRPFLGFGPSAFSYWEGERFRNSANLQRYARNLKEGKSPVDFREKLPHPRNIQELFAVRLRLLEGVQRSLFEPLPPELSTPLEALIHQGLLLEEGGTLRLTQRGLLFYDSVASELI